MFVVLNFYNALEISERQDGKRTLFQLLQTLNAKTGKVWYNLPYHVQTSNGKKAIAKEDREDPLYMGI